MPEQVDNIETLSSVTDKNGSILVVGAGVSGIQAALDASGSGFKVYLVEKGPAIGGKMSQLDKTFPTNDCSMCILSPKFIECATDPNIEIITNAQVEHVEGEAGNFAVQVVQQPRYVDEAKCTGCGTCTEYCPILVPDVYNEKLGNQKCIHIHFPQAVPAVSIVDPTTCLFLNRQECQICVPTCSNKAIDFKQRVTTRSLEVGSIILAPGYEAYDPTAQSHYGYGRFSNVVTGLEYERLLSASGPNRGELMRPSDDKVPEKIAWIQCVGSRDDTAGCTYCSAVCCMVATKQVILTKEHHPDSDVTVFHNDIRAFGKGFERFYNRAKRMDGVRFHWGRGAVLDQDAETGGVTVRYRINGSDVRDEAFDMVVLSVGLTATDGNRELARKLGLDINEHGFCKSPALAPVETSKEGVFACGVFKAPMDIPDSVTMASGAASLASQLLWEGRGTQVAEKVIPPERNITGDPPQVGVFVCDCGTNVVKVVDVPDVVSYARSLQGVSYAVEETFACSVDSVSNIIKTIQERNLNRVVVAACTPRTHEPLFRDAMSQAGLNPFLFEFANIREHCSFVHMQAKEAATHKAKDLVRMAVAKVRLLEPLYQISYPINRSALVIGGGVAGMMSSVSLARQGIQVHLLEKSEALGGLAMKIPQTLEDEDVQSFMQHLIDEVEKHPGITVHTGKKLLEYAGYVGNFRSTIQTLENETVEDIEHGITIVATGAEEYKPSEYLYEENDRVMTLLDLDAAIAESPDRFKTVNTMVFIQCVGSRNDERPYCSRVCCSHSIKNALQLKKLNPKMDIYVLYRDMRTFGFKEDFYKEASNQGVVFIRYTLEDKPEVEATQEEEEGRSVIRVLVTEPMLGQKLILDADMLCLAAASIPPAGNHALSQMLKVTQNEDGFFQEAHMKLRPVDFATDGIFMCGTAHSPKFIDESIAQAQAAASRAVTILSKQEIQAGGSVSKVDGSKCTGCSLCVSVCPYNAVALNIETGIAEVNSALCKGCGVCASSCRSGAIDVAGANDEQILSQVITVAG
jgi:heterodisulfide reductase subunit A